MSIDRQVDTLCFGNSMGSFEKAISSSTRKFTRVLFLTFCDQAVYGEPADEQCNITAYSLEKT